MSSVEDRLSIIDVAVANALNFARTLESELAADGANPDRINKVGAIIAQLSSVPAASQGLVTGTGTDVSYENPPEPTEPAPGTTGEEQSVDPAGAQPTGDVPEPDQPVDPDASGVSPNAQEEAEGRSEPDPGNAGQDTPPAA